MFDFFAPVKLPLSEFVRLVERVDDGVAKQAIALELHEDFPYRSLDILDIEKFLAGAFDEDRFLDLANSLDQLLYFALEGAPENVIRAWASEEDGKLGDEIIRRVQHIRDNMPHLAELWNDKSSSIVPPLVALKYDIVRNERGEGVSAVLYAAASRVSSMGRPDVSDASRLRVQLWPADVAVLIRELEHIRDEHFAGQEREGMRNDSDRNEEQG